MIGSSIDESFAVSLHSIKCVGACWSFFYMALITFMRAPPSWTKHLPKFLPPNTIITGLELQNVNLGDTQTLVHSRCHKDEIKSCMWKLVVNHEVLKMLWLRLDIKNGCQGEDGVCSRRRHDKKVTKLELTTSQWSMSGRPGCCTGVKDKHVPVFHCIICGQFSSPATYTHACMHTFSQEIPVSARCCSERF